jgi:phage tail sheath protein FI
MGSEKSGTRSGAGVRVEQLEAGARPIEGVGTAVAAFVGLAPGGPVNVPRVVRAVVLVAVGVAVVRWAVGQRSG